MTEDALSPGAQRTESPEEEQALLQRLRDGDETAFAELFSRHAEAVRRFALRLAADPADADDLTAEAFFRVLQALRRGSGPTDNVRTYLLTVARRVAWEWRGRRRDVPVTDEELGRRTEPHADNLARRTDHRLIARAFTSLPERWRSVLWRVEVEGERPAVAAPHFGLSPNATAALARRARDGLRAAYLQAHVAEGHGAQGCRPVLDKLGAYTAGGVKGAEARRIRGHLAGCRSCRSLHDELREVCAELRTCVGAMALPATAFAVSQQLMGAGAAPAAPAGGVAGAALGKGLAKGLLLTTRVKLALTAASVAAVGVLGVTAGPLISHTFGRQGIEADRGNDVPNCLPIASSPAGSPTAGSTAPDGGQLPGPAVTGLTPGGEPAGTRRVSPVAAVVEPQRGAPVARQGQAGGPAAPGAVPAGRADAPSPAPGARSEPGQTPIPVPTSSSTGPTSPTSPSPPSTSGSQPTSTTTVSPSSGSRTAR